MPVNVTVYCKKYCPRSRSGQHLWRPKEQDTARPKEQDTEQSKMCNGLLPQYEKNVARTKLRRRVIELPYLSAVKHTLTSVYVNGIHSLTT